MLKKLFIFIVIFALAFQFSCGSAPSLQNKNFNGGPSKSGVKDILDEAVRSEKEKKSGESEKKGVSSREPSPGSFSAEGREKDRGKGSLSPYEKEVASSVEAEIRNRSDKAERDKWKKYIETEVSEKSAEEGYDLTQMSPDMVYAVVYQMVSNPKKFKGKTVKMKGMFYSVYSESAGRRFYFCLIKDAMACCAQGLEFVLEDESSNYPDDYPSENTDIIVEGIFNTYNETDYGYMCRIEKSKILT